jgi:hypothetical protein
VADKPKPTNPGLIGYLTENAEGIAEAGEAQKARTREALAPARARSAGYRPEYRAPGAPALTPTGMEYRVDVMRSSLVGDRVDGADLEALLNARAQEGWMLRHIVETEVKGRVGPGGTMGLLIVWERRVATAEPDSEATSP